MKEIVRYGQGSVEKQIKKFSDEELVGQLLKENQNLAELGVRESVSLMAFGAARYGHLYEDRRYDQGGLRPTPMNYLMALVHSQPDLLKLPKDKFEKLGGIVSRIAMVADVWIGRAGPSTWPEPLCQRPQNQLPPKKP